MLKTLDVILVIVMLSAAAWTFAVKHQSEVYEEALRDVDRQIALERDTIGLLEADLSLLKQPIRLQRLAEAFQDELGLAPLEPQQIVGPDELPAEPAVLEPAPTDAADDFAQASAERAVR